MHQNSPSPIDPLLNKRIAARKILNDIFLFQIINPNHEMLEPSQKRVRVWVQRRLWFQGGEDVSNVGLLEGFVIEG